jgi:hypothetical protein
LLKDVIGWTMTLFPERGSPLLEVVFIYFIITTVHIIRTYLWVGSKQCWCVSYTYTAPPSLVFLLQQQGSCRVNSTGIDSDICEGMGE